MRAILAFSPPSTASSPSTASLPPHCLGAGFYVVYWGVAELVRARAAAGSAHASEARRLRSHLADNAQKCGNLPRPTSSGLFAPPSWVVRFNHSLATALLPETQGFLSGGRGWALSMISALESPQPRILPHTPASPPPRVVEMSIAQLTWTPKITGLARPTASWRR